LSKHYKFVQNTKCEFFPCHKTENKENFNCLFCFCPLYTLGDKCGGNFKITHGVKDCSDCMIPHGPRGYEYIMAKMDMVIEKGSEFIKDKKGEL